MNNLSPSIGVIYQFKWIGYCISENNNIYVGLTSTTVLRRLTMQLSDTSSIAQHSKNIHANKWITENSSET